jgi:L,D-peptidoglycan transpeptidase YkuD (ErfK/YbiS/YcfS/YnhG family)
MLSSHLRQQKDTPMGRPHATVTNSTRRVIVRSLSKTHSHGLVIVGPLRLRCALGKGGAKARKREGDGATPIGHWPVRRVYHRADHGLRPRCGVPILPIGRNDGWCDAIADRNYNRFVHHPYPASAERLWRDDGLYDRVLVIGHNDQPRRRGGGSAIFVHQARPGYRPTEGCIALSRRDLDLLLACIGRRTIITVVG